MNNFFLVQHQQKKNIKLIIRFILSFVLVGLSKHINNYRQTKIIFFYFIFLFGGLIYFFVDSWKIYKKQKKFFFLSILHHIGALLILLMSLVSEIYQENDEIRVNTYLVIFYLSRMVVLNTIVLYIGIIFNNKLKAITLFFFLLFFHISGAIQCFKINWKNNNFLLNYYNTSLLLLIPENIITNYKILRHL